LRCLVPHMHRLNPPGHQPRVPVPLGIGSSDLNPLGGGPQGFPGLIFILFSVILFYVCNKIACFVTCCFRIVGPGGGMLLGSDQSFPAFP
jgi:hypothetical protein